VQNTVRQMREDVEEKINRLPLNYFDRSPRGELLSRVTNDIDNVSTTLQQTMSQLLTSLMTVIAVLGMMFWISPLLALVALVTVPLSLIVTSQIMKRSQGQFVAQWRRTGKLNAQIEEAYSGHALVKVFGRQGEVEQTFAEENDELFKVSFGAQFVSGLIMPAMMFIGNLNYVLVAVVGGLRVASGNLSLGEVQAFIQYSRQFTQPLTTVASMTNLLQSGVASAERVFELLDADAETEDAPALSAPAVRRGEVAFEHVSFRYDEERPLITDLSLVARPGETVAIVGPTGAGKTTLVNLVMRFYELTGGRILLDGVDIREYDPVDLRTRISAMFQDYVTYQGTAAENIGLGDLTRLEDRPHVEDSARRAGADERIERLPQGYDSPLGRWFDQGVSLSGGEWQKIALARAFQREAPLLVLDEPTSALDAQAELDLFSRLRELSEGRTTLYISHRFSTVRQAERILLLEHGKVAEYGTHEELMAAKAGYAELFTLQAKAYLDEVPT
jgi:ATP-binding cassette subfamily B protein